MSDEEILQQIGLEQASEEVKARALTNINAIVELRMMSLVEAALTDEEKAEFEQLQNENGPADKAWAWLKERLDLDAIYNDILKDYIEHFERL